MRLTLVTDAWEPQTNGVVSTLKSTCRQLAAMGIEVGRISPEAFSPVPCPSYPEIRLALGAAAEVGSHLESFRPDAIHIATEGPLGVAARDWCLHRQLRFTTSYHTRFPEYVQARWPIPLGVAYRYMRWFHDAASGTMVSTVAMKTLLEQRGFRNLRSWSRGVDTDLFRPCEEARSNRDSVLPELVCVGRVAIEKNIEAFLRTPMRGRKTVIGDGPARSRLQALYPDVEFTGMLHGEALARRIAMAYVMVFPSLTDTFGLVMLEAMACGVPVAAFPVTGPIDVITPGVTGWMEDDIARAVERALQLDRGACRLAALGRSWQSSILEFVRNLVPASRVGSLSIRRWSTHVDTVA